MKNFIRKLSAVSLLIIMSLGVFAQTSVTGTVTSESDNEGLPGVNIVVKGTTRGVITNVDGKYAIDVDSPDDVLVFSMIGMQAKERVVGNRNVIDVSLAESRIGLDEVVVVGYGTMKKSDLTGSIVSMDEEQMTETKSNNVLESLQGKAAGVDIQRSSGRSGGGVDILIRGSRSLSASNSPLVIVDGIPYGDDIDINPADIESIEILKDVSSTAIYGSRGANGVILITTKKGSSDVSKVYFSAYYGVTEPFQKVPVFDREGYINAKIDANRSIDDWGADPIIENVFSGDEQTGYEDGTYTDWQDIVTQLGTRQSYHVGFMGGNDKFTYNTSISYYDEEGVVLADEFRRMTYKLNLEGKVTEDITVGGSSILTFKERNGRGPRYIDAVLGSPICEPYDSLGNYIYQPNFANPRKSPLAQTKDEVNDRTTRIFNTFYAQVQLSPNLSFRTNAGVDMDFNRYGYMYPQQSEDEGYSESGSNISHDISYTWTNLLNYTNSFGKTNLGVTLGQEAHYSRDEYYSLYGIRQDFERSLWYNLTTNKDQQITSNLVEQSMLSFFGRVNYNYDNKYLLNVTGRYDGASQLAEGNKWDFFPSASGAWRVSSEEFMKDISQISNLKLRVGYGVSGNSSVDPYGTAAALNANPLYVQFGEPGAEVTEFGYRPNSLSSKTLKWETTHSTNLGIDLGLFDNRVVANFDLFWSHTYDLLLSDKLPLSSGFFNVMTNAGETKSNGIELNLSTVNIDAGRFKWTSALTFSKISDEIVALTSGVMRDVGNQWFVGEPLKVIYDYKKEGVWQLDEQEQANAAGSFVGHIKVEDTNNDEAVNVDDRIILGQRDPKWTGSFINTFKYNGFDLTVNLYARMGHMIDASAYAFDPRMYDNQLEINYWTPNNPTNEYPRLDASLAEMDYEYTLRYKDGSFMKMKNLTLGYTLPTDLVSRAKMSKVRIYFSSSNPFILYTNLDEGIDPENGGSYNWPLARTFIFGINVEF
ncbi:MAG: TonB-dependent receptor [Prolixibacteraceae bacterium]|jgi:TonB-linked SusC/RagA family outer membrane protein|nr:TonB-dependent receptor [Prolixibacteraceae bacterium]